MKDLFKKIELPLLCAAITICVIAAVRVISVRNTEETHFIILFLMIGYGLALLCQENGKHSFARYAVMSLCWSCFCAVIIATDLRVVSRFLVSIPAAIWFLYLLRKVFVKLREQRVAGSHP